MSIIVLLSPSHFFLVSIIIYKSKTIMFSFQREIINTFLFKKLIKVSTNNFKIDIKSTSGRKSGKIYIGINPYYAPFEEAGI